MNNPMLEGPLVVTFLYVSPSTSELKVRLLPLSMFKSSIIFTDSSKAMLYVDLFSYICFTFDFIMLPCLFFAAL